MMLLGAGPADRAVLAALYVGDHPLLVEAAELITLLGDWRTITFVTLIATAGLLLKGRRHSAVALVVGTALGRLIVDLQKIQIGRLRPDVAPHLVIVRNLSFPSAHAANAILVYLSIALLLAHPGRERSCWMAAAIGLALVVGFSRLMLGVHYPSDVIGGWSFGLGWTLVVLWMARRDDRAA